VACQLTVLGLIVPRRMQRLLLLVAHSLDHRLARETTAPMTSDRIAAGSGIAHAHLYFLNVDPDLGVAVLTAEPRNKPWPPGEDGSDRLISRNFKDFAPRPIRRLDAVECPEIVSRLR
jgi:hypothetical protein